LAGVWIVGEIELEIATLRGGHRDRDRLLLGALGRRLDLDRRRIGRWRRARRLREVEIAERLVLAERQAQIELGAAGIELGTAAIELETRAERGSEIDIARAERCVRRCVARWLLKIVEQPGAALRRLRQIVEQSWSGPLRCSRFRRELLRLVRWRPGEIVEEALGREILGLR